MDIKGGGKGFKDVSKDHNKINSRSSFDIGSYKTKATWLKILVAYLIKLKYKISSFRYSYSLFPQ